MQSIRSLTSTLLLGFLLVSGHTSAGLILENYDSGTATPGTVGGYAMTDFAFDSTTGSTSTFASPISGNVAFEDIGGNALSMYQTSADTTDWWNNGESSDVNIFTTPQNWIRIILPENTRAFSFNVGAEFNGRAWIEGYQGDDLGVSKYNFSVNPNNTPGFGIAADNSDGSCGAISSVIVEPTDWGVGNFSINQSSCVTDVPEPGTLGLLALGLLGLGVLRQTKIA